MNKLKLNYIHGVIDLSQAIQLFRGHHHLLLDQGVFPSPMLASKDSEQHERREQGYKNGIVPNRTKDIGNIFVMSALHIESIPSRQIHIVKYAEVALEQAIRLCHKQIHDLGTAFWYGFSYQFLLHGEHGAVPVLFLPRGLPFFSNYDWSAQCAPKASDTREKQYE